MPTPTAIPASDLACETLYRFLAAALCDPRSQRWSLVLDAANQELALQAADLLREDYADEPLPLGFGEAPVEQLDLRPFLQALGATDAEQRAEHERVFGLVICRECPPYETEFQPNDEPFFRSQQMADVAGFYRAFGLNPSAAAGGRPDHLTLELEFAAWLLLKERLALDENQDQATVDRAAVCRDARASFVRDHLSWWVPSFTTALRHKAESGCYAALGVALAALVTLERHRLGIEPPKIPLEAKPTSAQETSCDGCLADLKS